MESRVAVPVQFLPPEGMFLVPLIKSYFFLLGYVFHGHILLWGLFRCPHTLELFVALDLEVESRLHYGNCVSAPSLKRAVSDESMSQWMHPPYTLPRRAALAHIPQGQGDPNHRAPFITTGTIMADVSLRQNSCRFFFFFFPFFLFPSSLPPPLAVCVCTPPPPLSSLLSQSAHLSLSHREPAVSRLPCFAFVTISSIAGQTPY